MIACQNLEVGGLKDKPGKHPDIYHTCYSLAGLSLSQTKPDYKGLYATNPEKDLASFTGQEPESSKVLLSHLQENSLPRINTVYNAKFDKLEKARSFFAAKVQRLKEEGMI